MIINEILFLCFRYVFEGIARDGFNDVHCAVDKRKFGKVFITFIMYFLRC